MSDPHGRARQRLRGAAPTAPGRRRPVIPLPLVMTLLPLVLTLLPLAAAAISPEQRAVILAPTSDFTAPERHEAWSGGTATNRTRADADAFSLPSASLSFEARERFFLGNGLFKRPWVVAPASTRSADGLGPLYNTRACQSCHIKDGRGHPPEGPLDGAVSALLRLSIPPENAAQQAQIDSLGAAVIAEPTYGGQVQDLAIPGHRPEGRLQVTWHSHDVALSDGTVITLRRPQVEVVDLGYGPLHPATLTSLRVANPMIGLGLLEAIAEADLLAAQDPDDADGDGISGRAQQVWSPALGRVAVGRFGWKAGNATLADQVAAASSGDMGLSSPLSPDPWGDCTAAQSACRAAPHGGSPQDQGLEIAVDAAALIEFYARHLAVPARRGVADPAVLRGKALFYGAGCIDCHTPKQATASGTGIDPALSGQLIWPYTDLLLHDMGEGLADHRPEGLASGREWRTAPLWGIGLTQVVNGHTLFLHDGRARTLTEAILWHGGEAAAAREAFRTMDARERDDLLMFLNSL